MMSNAHRLVLVLVAFALRSYASDADQLLVQQTRLEYSHVP